MSKKHTVEDIKGLGTIMGIWAHPDDETFWMGGVMAVATANGQMVVCVTATKGERGVQDESRWPANELAEIRERELKASFAILGVSEHHWLGYIDGECEQVDSTEAALCLAELIKQYRPNTIISFGPDGMTGHPDHIATSKWALAARDLAGSDAQVYHAIQTKEQYEAMLDADKDHDIFFNVDEPCVCDREDCDIYFVLADEIYDKKYRALEAMPSQTDGLLKTHGQSLRASEGVEAFVRAH